MSTTAKITDVLNGILQVLNKVIPLPVEIQKPVLISAPILQTEIGVLIGVTGDLFGRLIFEGSK
ncbi:hypothetical protein [Effusibacillus consociatus]|uniref:Uncharacterized protein n=1 Tax=Effusibacillus consociatus TaxID=1117041 RepID=A0ABV9PZJ2_9BACL